MEETKLTKSIQKRVTVALETATMPADMFKTAEIAAQAVLDATLIHLKNTISRPIELPKGVTAEDYAHSIHDLLDRSITEGMGGVVCVDVDYLVERDIDHMGCFYTLAKNNPEIAVAFTGIRRYRYGNVSFIATMPMAEYIDFHIANLDKELYYHAELERIFNFMHSGECTDEHIVKIAEKIGYEAMIKECNGRGWEETSEKIAKVADPLVKCAHKL